MQPRGRQHDREIGALRLGKFPRIRDDSPHMPLIVRGVARTLLCEERRN